MPRTYGKLREKIKTKYPTLKKFAETMGIDSSTLSLKINGLAPWKQPEIEIVCQLLCIPVNEIGEYFFYN